GRRGEVPVRRSGPEAAEGQDRPGRPTEGQDRRGGPPKDGTAVCGPSGEATVQPLQPGGPPTHGPYRLRAPRRAGGMGVVYLGRSHSGRAVAVKVIRASLAADAEYRARFRREVRAAREVTGTFTAALLDDDVDAPTPWLATAYLPGVTLREAITR